MTISFSALGAILQTEDMEGLIELGSPTDEYLTEAMEMQADSGSRDECGGVALVWGVWSQAFGPFSDDAVQARQPALERLVQRILAERLVSAVPMPAHKGLRERVS